MAKVQRKGGGIGAIRSGIEQNKLICKVIGFIYQQLPAWRDDPERIQELSETRLNAQLCKYLGFQARTYCPMIAFHHEEPQSSNRQVDLSVTLFDKCYSKYDPILVIECKRLPAPSEDREREYVTGHDPKHKGGGIQRFKLGLHARELASAAMIGYVQEKSFQDWSKIINGWISELSINPIMDGCRWNSDEILHQHEENVKEKIAQYRSVHGRIIDSKNDNVEIYHLWVAM